MRSIALTLALLLVALFMVGCVCDNERLAEHTSPDGQFKCVSFDRNCGATTGSNLQISILPASNYLPNTAANAFIADDNHGATSFVAQPEWVSDRQLRITYSAKARVFEKESKVDGVEIEYVEVP
jgi:hypothetical protein